MSVIASELKVFVYTDDRIYRALYAYSGCEMKRKLRTLGTPQGRSLKIEIVGRLRSFVGSHSTAVEF